eukprot:1498923-Prorocentrum_lima.AAC.1
MLPADIIVHHLGGVPSGWHIQDVTVPNSKGQMDTRHILLPNWCHAKEVLQKVADALHLPHG